MYLTFNSNFSINKTNNNPMLRVETPTTKILISIREVTHHLSLTLYMIGKITNDRYRKMEAWLKFGQLLGSSQVLMIPIRANEKALSILHRSGLKNQSAQCIEPHFA